MKWNPSAGLLFTLYYLIAKIVSAEKINDISSSATSAPSAPILPTPPNQILLVYADDLGPGDIGFDLQNTVQSKYKINTPNIDQLKKTSALYPSVMGATLCGPSRASLLTGRPIGYSIIRGNPDAIKNLPLPNITLPQALQKLNYKVTIAGKYGFGNCATNWGVRKFGFNSSLVFDTHVDAHFPFPTALSNDCRKINYPNNKVTTRTKCLSNRCSPAEDMALNFLVSEIKECATQNIKCAHFYMPISPHVGSYSGKKISTFPVTNWAGYPANWGVDFRGYAAMVTLLDARIKIVVDTLKELNIFNNTLLILMSDNGAEYKYVNGRKINNDPFDSAGGRKGRKRSMYSGGINTPAIVNWPQEIKPSTSNYPWATFDLATTILEILKAPAKIVDQFNPPPAITEGTPQSMAKLWLFGERFAPKRNYIFTENCEANEASCIFAALNVSDWRKSVTKLIRNTGNGKLELYDEKVDPAEKHNLIEEQQLMAQDMLQAWKSNRIPKMW